MRTVARIAHQIPGRVRVRVPEKRADEAFFMEVAEELAFVEGVERISTTADTGSLLIEHDPTMVTVEALLEPFFELTEATPSATQTAPVVALANGAAESDWLQSLRRFCSTPNSTQSITALVLIAYGIWQLSRGRRMGPDWFNAFWVAFNLMAIRK